MLRKSKNNYTFIFPNGVSYSSPDPFTVLDISNTAALLNHIAYWQYALRGTVQTRSIDDIQYNLRCLSGSIKELYPILNNCETNHSMVMNTLQLDSAALRSVLSDIATTLCRIIPLLYDQQLKSCILVYWTEITNIMHY